MTAIPRHPGGLPDDLAGAVDEALQPVLAMASRAASSVLQRLSPSQLQALLTIEAAGQMNLSGLAEAMEMIPSSATRLTQRLVSADLVSREEAVHDRREIVLTLTPSGRRTAAVARDLRRREIDQVLSGMSDRDRRRVLAGLRLLADGLARVEGDGIVEALARRRV